MQVNLRNVFTPDSVNLKMVNWEMVPNGKAKFVLLGNENLEMDKFRNRKFQMWKISTNG